MAVQGQRQDKDGPLTASLLKAVTPCVLTSIQSLKSASSSGLYRCFKGW